MTRIRLTNVLQLLPEIDKERRVKIRLPAVLFFIPLAAFVSPAAVGANPPQMRPGLIGTGSNALINLIDAEGLAKRGQGDAILLFYCQIHPDGKAWYYRVYRYSDGGDKLKDEVK